MNQTSLNLNYEPEVIVDTDILSVRIGFHTGSLGSEEATLLPLWGFPPLQPSVTFIMISSELNH